MSKRIVPSKAAPVQTPNFSKLAQSLGLPHLHQRADGSWGVPSATQPGTEYTVWLTNPARPTCSCPSGARAVAAGRVSKCWHLPAAQARAANTPFAPAPVRGLTDAQWQALVSDLCGPIAA